MNRTIKIGFAALALAAVAPAFAQNETNAEGPVGYTPVAIGLATPVQLPWGLNRWDVYGLDLNLFYSDAPTMVGLDIGGLATRVRNETKALVIGGLANIAEDDVYGLRATFGLNYSTKSVYGCDLCLFGLREDFCGFDAEFLGSYQRETCGLSIGGLVTVATEESHGVNIAGLSNITKNARGLQLSGLFNYTETLSGCQIALVNYTDACPSGFQIGLVNIIMQNVCPVLPIVNGYF